MKIQGIIVAGRHHSHTSQDNDYSVYLIRGYKTLLDSTTTVYHVQVTVKAQISKSQILDSSNAVDVNMIMTIFTITCFKVRIHILLL
jgi:hypothetical protein